MACWNTYTTGFPALVGLVTLYSSRNVSLLSPHPVDQEQGARPFANQHPKKQLILGNRETLTFASCTTNLLEQMIDFRRHIRFTPSLTWSLQGFQQNLDMEQSQSTLLRRVTHMAIVSVITRVINVRDQTIDALVSCSCPFCDCSCQFVYVPSIL